MTAWQLIWAGVHIPVCYQIYHSYNPLQCGCLEVSSDPSNQMWIIRVVAENDPFDPPTPNTHHIHIIAVIQNKHVL